MILPARIPKLSPREVDSQKAHDTEVLGRGWLQCWQLLRPSARRLVNYLTTNYLTSYPGDLKQRHRPKQLLGMLLHNITPRATHACSCKSVIPSASRTTYKEDCTALSNIAMFEKKVITTVLLFVWGITHIVHKQVTRTVTIWWFRAARQFLVLLLLVQQHAMSGSATDPSAATLPMPICVLLVLQWLHFIRIYTNKRSWQISHAIQLSCESATLLTLRWKQWVNWARNNYLKPLLRGLPSTGTCTPGAKFTMPRAKLLVTPAAAKIRPCPKEVWLGADVEMYFKLLHVLHSVFSCTIM